MSKILSRFSRKAISITMAISLLLTSILVIAELEINAESVENLYYFEDFTNADISSFTSGGALAQSTKKITTDPSEAERGKYLEVTMGKWNKWNFPFIIQEGTYKISYDYKVTYWSGILANIDTQNGVNPQTDWKNTSYNYTSSGSQQLYFYAGNNGDNTILLDNIKIQKQMSVSALAGTGGAAATEGNVTTAFYNETVKYIATASSGYTFKEWQDSTGAPVSTDATYVHTVGKDNALKAVFKASVEGYYFEDFSDADASLFTGGGTLAQSTKKITTDPNESQRGQYLELTMGKWNYLDFPFTLQEGTYQISFDYKVTQWSYMLNSAKGVNPADKWNSTSYTYNSSSNTKLQFYAGNNGDNTILLDNIKIQKQMPVSASAGTGGTAVIDGNATTAFYNDKIKYTATANDGYSFKAWKDSKNIIVSYDAVYEHTVGLDNALKAVFEQSSENYYFEDFSNVDASLFTGGGTLAQSTKNITTDPNESQRGQYLELTMGKWNYLDFPFTLQEGTYQISFDYKVTQWSYMLNSAKGVNPADKWNSTSYTYNSSSNTKLQFYAGNSGDNTILLDNIVIQKQMPVSASAKEGGTASIAGNATTAFYNDKIKYIAVPNSGYAFKGWENSKSQIVSTDMVYEHIVLEDNALTAVFKKDTTDFYSEDFTDADEDDFVVGGACSKQITSDAAQAGRGKFLKLTMPKWNYCKFPFYLEEGVTYTVSYDYKVTYWTYMLDKNKGVNPSTSWQSISFNYTPTEREQLFIYAGNDGENVILLDNIVVKKYVPVEENNTDVNIAKNNNKVKISTHQIAIDKLDWTKSQFSYQGKALKDAYITGGLTASYGKASDDDSATAYWTDGIYDNVARVNSAQFWDSDGGNSLTIKDIATRRLALKIDLGEVRDISEIKIDTQNGSWGAGRLIYGYTVYGAEAYNAATILNDENKLGSFLVDGQTYWSNDPRAVKFAKRANVRYIIVVFDLLGSDPGLFENTIMTELTGEPVIPATSYLYKDVNGKNKEDGYYKYRGAAWISEVEIMGVSKPTDNAGNSDEKEVTLTGKNITLNNSNIKYSVLSVGHEFSWDNPYPYEYNTDDSNDILNYLKTEYTTMNQLFNGSYEDVWMYESSGGGGARYRRGVFIDLGDYYDISGIKLFVKDDPNAKNANSQITYLRRYIYNYSVYGGVVDNKKIVLNPIGYGGEAYDFKQQKGREINANDIGMTGYKHKNQFTTATNAETSVRYLVIMFDKLGADPANLNDTQFNDLITGKKNALPGCSWANSAFSLSELEVYGKKGSDPTQKLTERSDELGVTVEATTYQNKEKLDKINISATQLDDAQKELLASYGLISTHGILHFDYLNENGKAVNMSGRYLNISFDVVNGDEMLFVIDENGELIPLDSQYYSFEGTVLNYKAEGEDALNNFVVATMGEVQQEDFDQTADSVDDNSATISNKNKKSTNYADWVIASSAITLSMLVAACVLFVLYKKKIIFK